MKNKMKFWIGGIIALSIYAETSLAQTIDEDRMKRDIEVAENVLATLVKLEMKQEHTFFGLDIKGSYQPGYGVTFRLPGDFSMPFAITLGGDDFRGGTVISKGEGYRYSVSTNGSSEEEDRNDQEVYKLKQKTKDGKRLSNDSIRLEYNDRVIKAAKDFILDYGDIISQLSAGEKIIVTNQGDRHHQKAAMWVNSAKRSRISVEGIKSDITGLRQGKLSREQALKKLTVVNTESMESREPDMEMLSSIFSRLYRPDLSKTYFTEGNVYYERLKDYGIIFYMQVYSSNERALNKFNIPTLNLDNQDKATRDKKVAELYPAFERDLKENILEYGRTIKSLKENEVLVFNVALTKCTGCKIPSTVELSIKASVLMEFGAGKMDKTTAMSKFTLKKGADQ